MPVAETGSPSRTSPWPDCFSATAMQRLRTLRLGDTKTRGRPVGAGRKDSEIGNSQPLATASKTPVRGLDSTVDAGRERDSSVNVRSLLHGTGSIVASCHGSRSEVWPGF
jgi:hypothetical protein